MKKLFMHSWFAGMAGFALLFLMAFTPKMGGYSYTIHLNGKLVKDYYLTSNLETPTITLSEQDLKGTLGIYFNECGQIGASRKLSLRLSDQKILKEWNFANNTVHHDPMEFSVNEISALLASGKVGVYYTSERLTKPQILAYLVSTPNTGKSKAASR
jgi:hypothetical protein